MGRILIFAALLTFLALPMAAQAEQWLLVKDREGKCSIWKTKHGTPIILSGPYATKDEARKALEAGECKKGEKKPEEKKTDQDKTDEKK